MKQPEQILTVFSLAATLGIAALPPVPAIADDNLIIPGQILFPSALCLSRSHSVL